MRGGSVMVSAQAPLQTALGPMPASDIQLRQILNSSLTNIYLSNLDANLYIQISSVLSQSIQYTLYYSQSLGHRNPSTGRLAIASGRKSSFGNNSAKTLFFDFNNSPSTNDLLHLIYTSICLRTTHYRKSTFELLHSLYNNRICQFVALLRPPQELREITLQLETPPRHIKTSLQLLTVSHAVSLPVSVLLGRVFGTAQPPNHLLV